MIFKGIQFVLANIIDSKYFTFVGLDLGQFQALITNYMLNFKILDFNVSLDRARQDIKLCIWA